MRLLLLFLTITQFVTNSLSAQNAGKLSDNAQISVITAGPYYEELYSAFGHSAIRVYDPVNNIDLAYNYGTFDFDQPNFYLNFARGNLLYKLSVQDYQRLKEVYIYQKRFIHEQILDLTPAQETTVFNFLQNNALPENATYNYDYFYDNCATRIRDVFVQTLGYDLRFESSHITSERTIRELCDDYLIGHYPWGDLGIDLCLGIPMDKVLAPIEYMYLPDYVEYGFDNAWIKTVSGEKPLVANKLMVFEPSGMEETRTWFTPAFLFILLFIAIVWATRLHYKKTIKGRFLDGGIFIIFGLLGVFLTLLWFATDHKAAAGNMNIIWAFPVHLIAGISLLVKREVGSFWNKYFKVTAIVMALLLITWFFLPQKLHPSLTFISAIAMVRAGYIGWGGSYDKSISTRE